MGNSSSSTRRSPGPNYDDYLAPEKQGKSGRSRSPSPFSALRGSRNTNDNDVPPPPPYPGQASTSSGSGTGTGSGANFPIKRDDNEDALDLLRKFNVVFIVDDSSSMMHPSIDGTRWEEAGNALAAIADVASKYDVDGIDIYFLNNEITRGNTGLKVSFNLARAKDQNVNTSNC
jgi:hypothetical protein